ncbi:MAG TPA: gamma-glutamyltransferase [Polyangiaceae bacterium]
MSANPEPARQPGPFDAGGADAATAELPELHGGTRSVHGAFGAVTSVEPAATRAGIAMLEQGGNAVDAAVAVAYALAVTHPSAGNLGGGGFMLVRPPRGPTVAIDFRETAPQALTRDQFDAMIRGGGAGPASVGVPGSVAGLELAHDRFGRLDRRTVLAPAIALAHGHRLGAHQAELLAWSYRALERDHAARAIFGDPKLAKQPKHSGDMLVQKDLAASLERIAASGAPGFYQGPTALGLIGVSGGLLSAADLGAYQAKVREPLTFQYQGYTVETMPPPSAGGVVVAEILLVLQKLHAERFAHDSADELHFFLEASKRAQAERRYGVVDPDALSAEENQRRRARYLDPTSVLGVPIDPLHATPASVVHPLYSEALREFEHTTHLSVADADGMVVSCTTTLSASFGSKLVAPGTGVVLNNSVASFASVGDNQPLAGRRTTSSMAPTLVLAGGAPVLVLGSPGGDTIPSTIVQILRHVIDHGEALDVAVDAPRVHHGFVPDEVRYEPHNAPPKAVLDELTRRGHTVKNGKSAIGDANEILLQHGEAFAYTDPREGGLALAASKVERRPASDATSRTR